MEKIVKGALLFSVFSWPSHVRETYNNLKNVSVRFRDITRGVAWTLPKIHCANGLENGIVSVSELREIWAFQWHRDGGEETGNMHICTFNFVGWEGFSSERFYREKGTTMVIILIISPILDVISVRCRVLQYIR